MLSLLYLLVASTLLSCVSGRRYPPWRLTPQKIEYAGINLTEIREAANEALLIDPEHPPYLDSNNSTEPTCRRFRHLCMETSWWQRKELAVAGASITNITIIPVVGTVHTHRLKRPMNFVDSLTEADINSLKSGWKVSTEVSMGLLAGKKDTATISAGLKLAAEQSSETMARQEVRKATKAKVKCDPNHQCWSELWTFAATISGSCTSRPMARCGQETWNVCERDDWLSMFCSANMQHYNKDCPNGLASLMGQRQMTEDEILEALRKMGQRKRSNAEQSSQCSMQIPLRQADGSPIRLMVGFANRLPKLSEEDKERKSKRAASEYEESELEIMYAQWS